MKRNQKGFTLIEIIVVIVILAVLMAVAVPSVLSYIHEADDAKRITEAKAVLTESQKYLVYKYNDERKTTSGDILGSFDETERSKVVADMKGNGELVRLSYFNGEIQRFIYKINDRYVIFHGYNEKFEVVDKVSENIAQEIMNNEEALSIVFAQLKNTGNSLDSEAGKENADIKGYADKINTILQNIGFDINNVSWKIEKLNNKNGKERFEFLISDQKITTDMVGQQIPVMKYIYYKDGNPDKSINNEGESNFDVEVMRYVVLKKEENTTFPTLSYKR